MLYNSVFLRCTRYSASILPELPPSAASHDGLFCRCSLEGLATSLRRALPRILHMEVRSWKQCCSLTLVSQVGGRWYPPQTRSEMEGHVLVRRYGPPRNCSSTPISYTSSRIAIIASLVLPTPYHTRNVQAGDLAGVLGGLTLVVVEVGGALHDGVGDPSAPLGHC